MKKNFIILIFTLISFTGVYSQSTELPYIKFGYSGPLTGELSRFGLSISEAIEDAIKPYKENFNIEVVEMDDQCDPKQAIINASKMNGENVSFVIGHVCSGATIQALPIYAENNILCITTSATNPNINENCKYKNFFRTIPNDEQQSIALINFSKKMEYNNIIVVYEINDYAMKISNGIKKNNNDMNINYIGLDVKEGKYFQEKTNSEDFIEAIKKAEIVIYCGYYIDFKKTYSFFSDNFNYKNAYIGCDGVYDNGLFEDTLLKYENVFVTTSDNYVGNKKIDNLKEKYIEEHGKEPGPFYERTFATIDMLMKIYKENGELLKLSSNEQSSELIRLLRNEEFDTYLGNIRFDTNGDILDNSFQFYKVEDSMFKFIEI